MVGQEFSQITSSKYLLLMQVPFLFPFQNIGMHWDGYANV